MSKAAYRARGARRALTRSQAIGGTDPARDVSCSAASVSTSKAAISSTPSGGVITTKQDVENECRADNMQQLQEMQQNKAVEGEPLRRER